MLFLNIHVKVSSTFLVYEEPGESRDLQSFAMSSADERSAVDSKKRKLDGELMLMKSLSEFRIVFQYNLILD